MFGRHKHDWSIEGASNGQVTNYSKTILCTIVLYRCACGAVKSERIDGEWTLKQLRGES